MKTIDLRPGDDQAESLTLEDAAAVKQAFRDDGWDESGLQLLEQAFAADLHEQLKASTAELERYRERVVNLAQALDATHPTIKLGADLIAHLQDKLEAVETALRAHHRWHLDQIKPEPMWAEGATYIPADQYGESALCEQTIAALSRRKIADGWDRLQSGGTTVMQALTWYQWVHRRGSREWRPHIIIKALVEVVNVAQ